MQEPVYDSWNVDLRREQKQRRFSVKVKKCRGEKPASERTRKSDACAFNSSLSDWVKDRRAISIFYLGNLRVGYASEARECCCRKNPPWRGNSRLMRYSRTLHNHHKVSLIAKWKIETTPNVDAVLLARAKFPIRTTKAKPVQVIFPTKKDSRGRSYNCIDFSVCHLIFTQDD